MTVSGEPPEVGTPANAAAGMSEAVIKAVFVAVWVQVAELTVN
ncbi:MAG: hypothetical protein ONB46_03540 [candidate division KSB1 bacterium]|nr:hypothetical protein [candidate division KSB1 bacterium]MDZ7365006.1 hypothetical protein [candidate division KSB1 bacterium]MDZ7403401.1 hypothetical protein [candidate division KSB1 bacterium]